MLSFDLDTYNSKYVNNRVLERYDKKNKEILNKFNNGELNKWLDINTYISCDEISHIKECAKSIRSLCDVFVVIGIGGSYMGSKALTTSLPKDDCPEIIYFGKNLDSNEYVDTLEYIKDKEIVVNVISKSGTTLEPNIAFNLVYDIMKDKYDESELRRRIYITTDRENGSLRKLADEKNYPSFVVPTSVGGRYSVFTPVGLLPLSVMGLDIDKILEGVKKANDNLDVAIKYADVCDIMYHNDKLITSITIYNEKLTYVVEWLKQLIAESLGKDKKGIFPVGNINTRDLHSMGQFLQEGTNIISETVIVIKNNKHLYIDKYQKDLAEINDIAINSVMEAHMKGDTPSSIIYMDDLDEINLGELMQFFMLSTITLGYLMEVNPFNQPGVQEYKDIIFSKLK